jgi:diaminohydroxyphosphoribosylaminopyrimidine deaminase/5-amino-6-(5-phosphoribosylamino)uracil reductase
MSGREHDAALPPGPWSRRDRAAMEAALDAAALGSRGGNPLVGAVIADAAGEILHVGHHRGAGTPHAEVDALEQARAAGTELGTARMYVTLEPCNHTGRTGPCSAAILAAGVGSVVYGDSDTTAWASGGARFLAEHGVEVRGGLMAERSRRLNHRWWLTREHHRPFVTAKVAASMDGCVAAPDGTSQWITGPEARAHGHELRGRVDAVLVGTGTALADDPLLTRRGPDGAEAARQPLRAVMGLRDLPPGARLNSGAGHLPLRSRVPEQALKALKEASVEHVLIEGGPGLITAFLAADLVDEIYWYAAPLLLGGGTRGIGDLGAGTLGKALRWEVDPAGSEADRTAQGVGRRGPDLLTHLHPAPATKD